MIAAIQSAVAAHADFLKQLARDVYAAPETGFFEHKTAARVAKAFADLGVDCQAADGIPALRTVLDTGRPGPTVAILGEMDAILCADHPHADPATGAVHACGHHAQVAALVGALIGLRQVPGLCGKIVLMAVPAEEYIQIAKRLELRAQGAIKYLGGKPELMHRGWFDGVDIALMMHTHNGEKPVFLSRGCIGCMAKSIAYQGVASHAGGGPHLGVNALYAAQLGLSAINALRETFREDDLIRVHPIITKGGDVVNVIPSDVRLETFVRGATLEAIAAAAKKVDRALGGGAYAMGAKVVIQDIPGYMPLHEDGNLRDIAFECLAKMGIEDTEYQDHLGTGSTDMGDLSAVMPVLQPYVGGAQGQLHSKDFCIADEDQAYLTGGQLLAAMAATLLQDGAVRAKTVIDHYAPKFKSIADYLAFQEKQFATHELP